MTIAIECEMPVRVKRLESYPRLMDQPIWNVARILEEQLHARGRARVVPETTATWEEEPERWDGLS